MKKTILNSIVCILFIFSSCSKKKDADKNLCEYNRVIKKVAATYIDGKIDGEFTVSLEVLENNTDEIYRISNIELNNIVTNFELQELSNSSNIYKLKYDEISKGSCTPLIIKKLILIK